MTKSACTYCGAPLGFATVLKGDSFCTPEHQQQYLAEQSAKGFDRLQSHAEPSSSGTESHPAAGNKQSIISTPATQPARSRWWIGALAAVLGIAVLGLLLSPASKRLQASTSVSSAWALNESAPAPVPGSHVSIRTTASSWVVACADGKLQIAKLFTAGSLDSLEFSRTAIVRTENAGATHIDIDGKPVGSLGSAGKAKVIELNGNTWTFREGGEADDCTKGF